MSEKTKYMHSLPSIEKPWLKCPALQDLITENLDLTDSHIADTVLDDYDNGEFSRDDLHEIVVHSTRLLRRDVLQRIEAANPILRTRRIHEARQKKEEAAKEIQANVTEWNRKLARNIMNMTGGEIRGYQAIPGHYFAKVGRDQLVSDVYDFDEIMIILTKHPAKDAP